MGVATNSIGVVNSAGDAVKRKTSVVASKQGVVAEAKQGDPFDFDLGTNSTVHYFPYAESQPTPHSAQQQHCSSP